ncbi:SPOR domain-containing protein [Piscinibacter koreensis]|uniref:SPOR domain-containing protein n=1 Tax=Piscinibacter koreensis TaxID=2742824 RepID=A0A7Y6TVJ8_9BURK|nr:SPOR domain-containing protein [Schlegelella koreensis]NUZ05194.1 SPOR domain-containing protein [Schlegelella koreensis]
MFKSKPDAAPRPAAEPGDPVQQARTRARQRLIGAVVLLVVGIIGFPLVFETQPRPIPVDIPIEIPSKDRAPPLTMPAERAPLHDATPPPEVARADAPIGAAPRARGEDGIITELASEGGREVAPRAAPAASAVGHAAVAAGSSSAASTAPAFSRAASTPARAASTPARAASAPSRPASTPARAASAPTRVASAPARAASAPTRAASAPAGTAATAASDTLRRSASGADDGNRAKALLEGRGASSADASRFVVQVGAFSDAHAARETRQKIERLGLKTYTQVAQTPGGPRVRVRLGPFASRGEADAALSKARAAGLGGVVLGL